MASAVRPGPRAALACAGADQLALELRARRVKAVDITKAVASSGAIAGWFASDSYKLLWGCIIAAAQLLDVLKDGKRCEAPTWFRSREAGYGRRNE